MAPIALFVYNRPEALVRTIASLQANISHQKTDLFVFSDGPKNQFDSENVEKVRKIVHGITGFKSIQIIESEQNLGLANSIINGVGKVLSQFNNIIVLEDDLIVTSNFIDFMNAALDHFESQQKVFSISGFSFDLKINPDEYKEGYFLNRGWSWGWATWKNRWVDIDWSVNDYASFSKNNRARAAFAMGGSDLNSMLDKQMHGKIDSWAIRWFYSQFKLLGLTYYPIYSKVYNNGFGPHATHTKFLSKRYLPNTDKELIHQFSFPKNAQLSNLPQQKFRMRMGYMARIKSKIEKVIQLCLGLLKR